MTPADDQDPDVPYPKYKVERQLRDTFPRARKPQRSGVSVDVRLYFREKPTGELWGGLAVLDEDGKILENMPLDSPAGLRWLLADVLCDVGFAAAPSDRVDPLRGAP